MAVMAYAAEPTDAEIEARLHASREQLARIEGALDAVRTIGIGRLAPDPVRDGPPGESLSLTYPVDYAPEVWELFAALDDAGAQLTFDWPSWWQNVHYPDAASLTSAPVADCVRLLAAVRRAERFTDGAIAGLLSDGRLIAAAENVLVHLRTA